MIVEEATENMSAFVNNGKAGHHAIRTDAAYVPSGENDNLIVQKLNKNADAFGIFGYSFLAENGDKVQGANINGVSPTPETIASGDYPVSRSLFFYIKNSHSDNVPAMKAYIEQFMSESMIGQRGRLKSIGLIPLASSTYKEVVDRVQNREKLTLNDLK
jgi:phosphate transport system substrate-binding protein